MIALVLCHGFVCLLMEDGRIISGHLTYGIVGLQVWLLKPVALEDQARELLRACNYDQALRLAELCASEGAAWAEVASAEAAFMLMQGRCPLLSISYFAGGKQLN